MPQVSWKIELRTNHDDPSKDGIMEKLVRGKAKELFTSALLIQDKRSPQITIECGDLFVGTQEINLDAPEEADVA
jgi:hypothetical protein